MHIVVRTCFGIIICATLGFLSSCNQTVVAPAAVQPFSFSKGTYQPIDSGSVLLIRSNADPDSFTTPAALPFAFTFGGRSYTLFSATENGSIALSSPSIPQDSTLLLHGLSDDLSTGQFNGRVHYAVSGTSPNRVLTVEFRAMRWRYFNNTENANFQIKLIEGTNRVEYVYGIFGGASNVGAWIGYAFGARSTFADDRFLSVVPGTTPSAVTSGGVFIVTNSNHLSSGTTFRFER